MSLFRGNCLHSFGHFVHSCRTIDKVLNRNVSLLCVCVGVVVEGGGDVKFVARWTRIDMFGQNFN